VCRRQKEVYAKNGDDKMNYKENVEENITTEKLYAKIPYFYT
jgi:hypothetical protein